MIAKLFEAVYEPNYYGHYGWPWRIALTSEGCLVGGVRRLPGCPARLALMMRLPPNRSSVG